MPDQTDSPILLLEERILGIKGKTLPGTDGCADGLEPEYKDISRIMGELASHARELKTIDPEYDVDTGIQAVISLYDITDGIVSLMRLGKYTRFKKAYKKFPSSLSLTAEMLHKYADEERQGGTDTTIITKRFVASLVELNLGLPEAALYCEALLGAEKSHGAEKPRRLRYSQSPLSELISYYECPPDYANEIMRTVYFTFLALDTLFKTRAKCNPAYLPTPENAVKEVEKFLGLPNQKPDCPSSN